MMGYRLLSIARTLFGFIAALGLLLALNLARLPSLNTTALDPDLTPPEHTSVQTVQIEQIDKSSLTFVK